MQCIAYAYSNASDVKAATRDTVRRRTAPYGRDAASRSRCERIFM